MDLVCIIANKYSKSEIVEIKDEIDSWTDIQEFVINYRKSGDSSYQQIENEAKWEYDINEEELEKIWEYQESKGRKRINVFIGTNRISNFYSDITFNRKTITLCPSPEHKYANLHEPSKAKYLVSLMRMITDKFGQKEIIYCVDSMYPPGMLYSESNAGKTFEELKRIGIDEFGKPNGDLNEGMKDLFFIDIIENELPVFKKWNWSDFKYKNE